MLKEYKTMIILTLCCLTMISIGFSSWVVTNPNSITSVDGSLEADSIINNKNYITAESSAFTYGKLGFLDNDVPSNIGTVSIKYTIDSKNCRDYFKNTAGENCDGGLLLSVTMKYKDGITSDFDIFNQENIDYTVNCVYEDITYNLNPSYTVNKQIDISFTLDNIVDDTQEITFNYNFEIPYGAIFKNGIYDNLLASGDFEFAFSAKLYSVSGA